MRCLLTKTIEQIISKDLRLHTGRFGMNKTDALENVYTSMLRTLIERREELVKEIEEINEQIVELKKEANESGVTLA